MDDLTAEFIVEATESLAELDTALVKFEKDPGDLAIVDGIFRIVHTIKGTCGFLDLPRLEAVAHAAEDVLAAVRAGKAPADETSISPILVAIDRIKFILTSLEETGEEPDGDDNELVEELSALAGEPAHDPEAGPNSDEIDLGDVDVDPAFASPARDEAAAPDWEPTANATKKQSAARSIRVAVDLLEDLIAMTSELVLARNQLLEVQREQDSAAFDGPLQRLDLVTSELQAGVMQARLQPIGVAWAKLPRIVRDLERELGKRIELDMLGETTELDRQVLETIRDPLLHMVRNSCDHGLEPATERLAAGKPEVGRITLHAYHESGHVVIRIADDGRGLPVDRIREKALKLGLANAAELAAMADADIARFIFANGFSTADAVSAVSGRGVGMDVVRESIESAGGHIDVDSVEGVGATFTIRIPMTLAIMAALIVECGGERFAIPQHGIRELVRVGGASGNRVEAIGEAMTLQLRDELLPAAPLAAMLAIDARTAGHEQHAVVCENGRNRFCILVDRVFDTGEIVVKPLARLLRETRIFAGNTVLGDGDVVMILDAAGVAGEIGLADGAEQAGHDIQMAQPRPVRQAKTAVLLFKTGPGALKLAPLSAVARLEDIPMSAIQQADGRDVVAFRGALMPILDLCEGRETADALPALVFGDGDRWAALAVEEIIDIVDISFELELEATTPGVLGALTVDGRTVDVIDVDHHLRRIYPDWSPAEAAVARRNEILVVDDSPFFRHLLNPLLREAGYDVTAVESAGAALALKDAGRRFDVIVSDIDMPGMDGFAFAEAVRTSREWRETPLLALCGDASDRETEEKLAADFAGFVGKNDRDALLTSLAAAVGAGGRRA